VSSLQNGPFFYKGVYHAFYQRHSAQQDAVAEQDGSGPVWGHWVSRDFLHWAQMPVALWNDHWYDNNAVFSGSTAVIPGKGPVIVYPGRCHGTCGPLPGQPKSRIYNTYNIALPANLSDPLLLAWRKPDYNPIIQLEGMDPTALWQTEHGEWRFQGGGCGVQGDGYGVKMHGTMDLEQGKWYDIANGRPSECGVKMSKSLVGDCPSLYPLPPLTPGSSAHHSSSTARLPTHVYKAGCTSGICADGTSDRYQLGNWTGLSKSIFLITDVTLFLGNWTDGTPGANGTAGTWAAMGPVVPMDKGRAHSAKDFWDPVLRRRVVWVWANANEAMTVPREVTYDPRINR
jgi:beta-fructofuranosidase